MTPVTIALVVAHDRNRVIGLNGGLPWRLPADLRRFRAITMGKPMLMGRRTHASIGRPLPGRTNIVLTRDPDYQAPGCLVVTDFTQALRHAATLHPELMVIGGASLYAMALPFAQRIYLTEVQASVSGDTFFPDIDPLQWAEVARESHTADAVNEFAHAFVVFARVAPVSGDIAVQH